MSEAGERSAQLLTASQGFKQKTQPSSVTISPVFMSSSQLACSLFTWSREWGIPARTYPRLGPGS